MREEVDRWIRLAYPEQLRSMRAGVASQISQSLPRRRTQSGYLPRALVAAAVDAFGWWPFGDTTMRTM